jgi:hypothetical protein
MRYEIVEATVYPNENPLVELERKVQPYLDDGWIPIGPATPIHWPGVKMSLTQTLIKED